MDIFYNLKAIFFPQSLQPKTTAEVPGFSHFFPIQGPNGLALAPKFSTEFPKIYTTGKGFPHRLLLPSLIPFINLHHGLKAFLA